MMIHLTLPRLLMLTFVCLLVYVSGSAYANNSLEIESPKTIQVIYTIEPEDIAPQPIQKIVREMACNAGIKLGKRQDAQLFLRVEEHAGQYLLYLDFNRQLFFSVDGKNRSTTGFVWGRYAKNIENQDALLDDIEFFVEEFFSDYQQANNLK